VPGTTELRATDLFDADITQDGDDWKLKITAGTVFGTFKVRLIVTDADPDLSGFTHTLVSTIKIKEEIALHQFLVTDITCEEECAVASSSQVAPSVLDDAAYPVYPNQALAIIVEGDGHDYQCALDNPSAVPGLSIYDINKDYGGRHVACVLAIDTANYTVEGTIYSDIKVLVTSEYSDDADNTYGPLKYMIDPCTLDLEINFVEDPPIFCDGEDFANLSECDPSGLVKENMNQVTLRGRYGDGVMKAVGKRGPNTIYTWSVESQVWGKDVVDVTGSTAYASEDDYNHKSRVGNSSWELETAEATEATVPMSERERDDQVYQGMNGKFQYSGLPPG